mgnify:FL=1
MLIHQILQYAAGKGLERLDAQLLLLHALGQTKAGRAWLIAHDDDALSPAQQAAFEALVQRRLGGEPVAYLLGEKEFRGLTLQVDSRVLIPRPDTETLVDWALELLQGQRAPLVLDLGTGSGAIALAIKHYCPQAQVTATDASPEALQVARANAQALGLQVTFTQSDWLGSVPHQFHLIASNPPYIAEGDEHLAALTHEPASALSSGTDGLQDIRCIISQAPQHLHLGGWLLLEHGYDQAAAVRALLEQAGFAQVQSRQDLAGIERVSGGRWQEAR